MEEVSGDTGGPLLSASFPRTGAANASSCRRAIRPKSQAWRPKSADRISTCTIVIGDCRGLVCRVCRGAGGCLAARGFLFATFVAGIVIIGYGIALETLARSGYLIPPDVNEKRREQAARIIDQGR